MGEYGGIFKYGGIFQMRWCYTNEGMMLRKNIKEYFERGKNLKGSNFLHSEYGGILDLNFFIHIIKTKLLRNNSSHLVYYQRRKILVFSRANMGEYSNMGEYFKWDVVIQMKGSSNSMANMGEEKDVKA